MYPTIDDVREALTELKDALDKKPCMFWTRGLDAAKQLLRQYGVSCSIDLKPEDRAAVIAEARRWRERYPGLGVFKPAAPKPARPSQLYGSEKWGDFNMLVRTEIAAGKLRDRHVLRHWPLDGSARLQHEGARYHMLYDYAGRRRPWVSV